jgi:hypothetical protein
LSLYYARLSRTRGDASRPAIGPYLSRGTLGAIVGGMGLVIGAGIGALLPRHTKELVYSAK